MKGVRVVEATDDARALPEKPELTQGIHAEREGGASADLHYTVEAGHRRCHRGSVGAGTRPSPERRKGRPTKGPDTPLVAQDHDVALAHCDVNRCLRARQHGFGLLAKGANGARSEESGPPPDEDPAVAGQRRTETRTAQDFPQGRQARWELIHLLASFWRLRLGVGPSTRKLQQGHGKVRGEGRTHEREVWGSIAHSAARGRRVAIAVACRGPWCAWPSAALTQSG
mmetsp:Transcript_101462/g.226614  ORF Transcript_101462/g.226614 Transcript_101462/m.226614 type:complete len:227 (-) Transcript_101462:1465-2145(-)